MAQVASIGFMQRTGVRQFVKFCIIGFSSMIIDVGIMFALINRLDWHWIPAQIVSFSVAVTNGYIWNSMWTFRGLGSGGRHVQYAKFVIVNIFGLVFNIGIMKVMLLLLTGDLFTGHWVHHGNPASLHLKIAKGVAILCVSMWNFVANKKWTFSE